MSACFDNSTGVNYDYMVGIADSRKSMCHDHHSASAIKIVKIADDFTLVFRVKRIGGFVKEYEFRVAVDGAGYKYSLCLSFAESYAVASDTGVVA